jgi:hypothetical protein
VGPNHCVGRAALAGRGAGGERDLPVGEGLVFARVRRVFQGDSFSQEREAWMLFRTKLIVTFRRRHAFSRNLLLLLTTRFSPCSGYLFK